MNDQSLRETLPGYPASSATPDASGAPSSGRSKVRRLLSGGKIGRIVATTVICPVIALSVGLAVSRSASAAQLGSGSNARSGPAPRRIIRSPEIPDQVDR
jgi:hypothetical protein